jgi:uncharacterized membrane protein YeaQ/YmgE (transglycosylase-associated protein family)
VGFFWSIIIGGLLGWLASLITKRDIPGGIFGNIVAGFIGSWIGSFILGKWGPEIGGFYIIPAIVGSVILILLFSLITNRSRRNKA